MGETTNSLLMQIADLLQFCNPSHIIEIQCHILCYALKFYYDLQVRELINILVATSLEHLNEDGAVISVVLHSDRKPFNKYITRAIVYNLCLIFVDLN